MAKRKNSDRAHDLSGLLESLRSVGEDGENVAIKDIHATIGERSFGPLLLVTGLIQMTPVGAIPGVPTILGLFILITAGQVLIGRDKLWIPKFIADRSVDRDKLEKSLDILKPAATVIDKIMKPRLGLLLSHPAIVVVATLCMFFAAAMPPLEFVPFGGAIPASAVVVFGLALMFRDGLLVILGGALGIFGLSAIGWAVF